VGPDPHGHSDFDDPDARLALRTHSYAVCMLLPSWVSQVFKMIFEYLCQTLVLSESEIHPVVVLGRCEKGFRDPGRGGPCPK
jgi:hypothetical protein